MYYIDEQAIPFLTAIINLYIIIITLQFQCVFAHGLVDDRKSKFKILYRIMGLDNKTYIISSYISFFILCSTITFLLLVCIKVVFWYRDIEVLLFSERLYWA
jgi:hypothetical protein